MPFLGWFEPGSGTKIDKVMSFGSRKAIAAFLVFLVMLTSVAPVIAATPCLDGCEDEQGASCANCPVCSPGRAIVLLGQVADPILAEPASAYETLLIVRPSRTEDRGVFHVPRPTV